jgi:hypothetical protein
LVAEPSGENLKVSDIAAGRIASRWIRLRRTVVIAGLALATINTALVYVNLLNGRSRAAIGVLGDLNASFSQPTISYARPCMRYVLDTFDEDDKDLKGLWTTDDLTFVLKDPVPSAKDNFSICFSGLQGFLPNQGLSDIGPRAVYYLRRQILGYFNVHELAYSTLVDNNVDNYKLCMEWGELNGKSLIENFVKRIMNSPTIGAAEFAVYYPATYTFYQARICSYGPLRKAFRNYVGFLIPIWTRATPPVMVQNS